MQNLLQYKTYILQLRTVQITQNIYKDFCGNYMLRVNVMVQNSRA